MKTVGKIICLLLIASLPSTAQTEKGHWQVAAQMSNLSYLTNSSSYYTTFTGTLTPSVGCFLATNLLVGVDVPVTTSSSSYRIASAFKETRFGVGLTPFIQYYIGKAPLKPYIGGSYSYSFDNYTFKYENPSSLLSKKGSSRAFIPSVGLAYFLSKTVALNAGLLYSIGTVELNGPSINTPSVIIEASKSEIQSLSLSFGVQLTLGK